MKELFENLRAQDNDRLQAWVEYRQEQEKMRERTAQLRALRLARDAKTAEVTVAEPTA
jgi:hypothetical protein